MLFAAAATLWGLLVGVLITLLTSENGGGPSLGFWIGVALMAAAGFGWGARLRDALAGPVRGGLALPILSGIVVLLLAGLTALVAGLALTALASGSGATWTLVRGALAQPSALALPVLGLALVGAPLGAAAGLVLRAMNEPGDDRGSG